MKFKKGFASDNSSGVHPKILAEIVEVNSGHCVAYGGDPVTEEAEERFRSLFGKEIEVFFVTNGTSANVLGLKTLVESYQSVICAEGAHLNTSECGAPELHLGSKLVLIPSKDGKITAQDIEAKIVGIGDQHTVQPGAISISQPTEWGTVYSAEEVRKIAEVAHCHGMILHMDGARIANAAAFLKTSFSSFTRDAGVDVLSFGGTKTGLLFGEAVVFFERSLKRAKNFKYIRKQGMQLISKMRFVSAQFNALLKDDLWLEIADHSNQMAKLLAEGMRQIPQLQITQAVETNAVFAKLPQAMIEKLQTQFYFYVWDERVGEVRWMTAFDTTADDVKAFIAAASNTSR